MAVTIIKRTKPKKPSNLVKSSTSVSINTFQRPLITLMGDKALTMSQIASGFPDIGVPKIRYQIAQMVKQGRLNRFGNTGANGDNAVHYSLEPTWACNFPEWCTHFLSQPIGV